MFFTHDRIVSFVCGQFQDYLNVTQFYLNDQLIEDLNENTKTNLVKYLVGNFSDLAEHRQVTKDEALAFMR